MATTVELRARVSELQARKTQLEGQVKTLESQLSSAQAESSALAREQRAVNDQLRAKKAIITSGTASQAEKDQAFRAAQQLENQYNDLESRMEQVDNRRRSIESNISNVNSDIYGITDGVNSRLEEAEKELALAEKTPSTNPPPEPTPTNTSATADADKKSLDKEAEDAKKTEAVPNTNPDSVADKKVAQDDSGTADATVLPEVVVTAQAEESKIKPRPNPLDEYSSYTYQAAVYVMNEDQYRQFLQRGAKEYNTGQLLFQTGGAAANQSQGAATATTSADSATPNTNTSSTFRNPYFGEDFYIDKISFSTRPAGKGSGAAHNNYDLKFSLHEPMGITLFERLPKAVAANAPKDGAGRTNYAAATYLMVIRFLGYDKDGKPVAIKSKFIDDDGVTQTGAVIEKYIPFRVNGINLNVSNKLVTYDWDCAPIGHLLGTLTGRGTVPYDIQITEGTVGGMLGGTLAGDASSATGAKFAPAPPASNPGQTTTATSAVANQAVLDQSGRNINDSRRLDRSSGPTAANTAPPKADAAPKETKTLVAGLAGALNDFQQQLVKNGTFTFADEYVINFVGDDAQVIFGAALQLNNQKVEKKYTVAGRPTTSDPKNIDPGRTAVDNSTRSISIVAGQPIVQVIEQTIRNSAYISDQASVIIDNDGTTRPNPNQGERPIKWFNITMTAVPISELDLRRGDCAYRITYTISSRKVKTVAFNRYFTNSVFTGVHKRYPYWFTGENTAVIDYQENLNTLYQLTVSGSDTQNSNQAIQEQVYASDYNRIIQFVHSARSNESSHGAGGKQLELAANLAEQLYSTSDLKECKVKIIGDPDWIMQGSVFNGANSMLWSTDTVNSGFNTDGSISFDTQDVLFEVAWQRPQDWDIATGLANPYRVQGKWSDTPVSRVYVCTNVTSEFSQGSFYQTLEGALVLYPVPSNTSAPSGPLSGAAWENQRSESDATAATSERINAGGPLSGAAWDNQNTSSVLGAQNLATPLSPAVNPVAVAAPVAVANSNNLAPLTTPPPPAAPTDNTGVALALNSFSGTITGNGLQFATAIRLGSTTVPKEQSNLSSNINPNSQNMNREA